MKENENTTELNLSDIEKEIGILLCVRKAVQSMVNRGLLTMGENLEQVTIRPNDSCHADLFSILLVDFISPTNPFFGKHQSYLDALENICLNPHFNNFNSVETLRKSVGEFKLWLAHEAVFEKIWLSSIDQELTLTMRREEFLRICGDISKHNILRLSRTVERILKILNRSNPELQIADAYKAMEDFYEWFHNDKFRYHLTKISELLNNISWAIQDYLQHQFNLSYKVNLEQSNKLNHTVYYFEIPTNITSELGKFYYWDLMNEIRAKPYIPKFKTWPALEGLY